MKADMVQLAATPLAPEPCPRRQPSVPQTRRIVFLNNKPATLPGWAELAIED